MRRRGAYIYTGVGVKWQTRVKRRGGGGALLLLFCARGES